MTANPNPFLGTGVSFPLRINATTKDFSTSVGNTDVCAVSLAYLSDSWTAQTMAGIIQNLIAESIAHIVLTNVGEYDTLPLFGSKIMSVLFDPNSDETRIVSTVYFNTATNRWEKRAQIPQGGVNWQVTTSMIMAHQVQVSVTIAFIPAQIAGNLVEPFVTPQQIREQEYPTQGLDASGHDYNSRYYGCPIVTKNGISYNKLKRRGPIPYARDDYFYTTKPRDTFLYISNDEYGDIRYAWLIARMYVQDQAKNGAPRSTMMIDIELPVNTVLRMPSRSRLLNQLSVYQY